MALDLQIELNKAVLYDGSRKIGSMPYRIVFKNRILTPKRVEKEATNISTAYFDFCRISDSFILENGRVIVNRVWQIKQEGYWRFLFDFYPVVGEEPEWTVPSVMYQQNKHGEGKFPKGGIEDGFAFREDRIPVPSCSILENGDEFHSVFTTPAKAEREISSIKTHKDEKGPYFQISVPHYEEPFRYVDKGLVTSGRRKPRQNWIHVTGRNMPYEYQRLFFIQYGKTSGKKGLMRQLHETADDYFQHSCVDQDDISWNRIASLKLEHLKFLVIDNEKKDIVALKMGKGNSVLQPYYQFTAGSFLIKSLEGAVILARAGVDFKDDSYLDLARRMGTFFLRGKLDNGLHQDMMTLGSHKWGGYLSVGHDPKLKNGVNTRCNGEVMYNYLRLYSILEKKGISSRKFLQLVEDNVRFYVDNQLEGDLDGSFGRWWSKDGEPLNTLGSNGAYIVSVLIALKKIIGDDNEINVALRRAADFYGNLIDKQGYYADTLDADCIDKEAGCSLLKAFLDLYDEFDNDKYLQYAKKAADFILGWTWSYNVAFDPASPLGQRGCLTKGLTSVSVAHHHLDFYGMAIGYDFLRLHLHTGDEFWQKKALEMINSCGQIISDDQDLLGRSRKFRGWQPEQIDQTEWNYVHPVIGAKGHFRACAAWVVVLTLGSMLDIRKDFPQVMNFSMQESLD